MFCPKCRSENYRVVDTIPSSDGSIYRRRKCNDCGGIFRSVEIQDDGSLEFSKGYKAASERKSPSAKLNKYRKELVR